VAVIKRIAATVVLGLFVIGCGLLPERVPLLTGTPYPEQNGKFGCYTAINQTLLTYDPTYGTVDGGGPVAWPPGFTARRAGSEAEVLDPSGNVVAITGKRYWLEGGTPPQWPDPQPKQPISWWVCGAVHLLP
jgi:hypothetical protein